MSTINDRVEDKRRVKKTLAGAGNGFNTLLTSICNFDVRNFFSKDDLPL